MKKGMYVCGICLIMTIILSSTSAFGQDGKVNISSPDGSVKIDSGGVKVRNKDGSSVQTEEKKGVNVKAASGTVQLKDDATISGRTIMVDGDGIILKGQGDYVLVDCKINAGRNAVVVMDNATVTMKNCVITGAQSAILIKDNGTVKASKNVISGKIKKEGNADFSDQGGNIISRL